MAGNLTAGGLGQPGGLLVTGGMGAAQPAAPGAISAHLYGSGTLTVALTDGSSGPTQPYQPGGGRPVRWDGWLPDRQPIPGPMAAHLYGSGSLTGDLEGVLLIPLWVDQLADLLLFDLV